MRKRARKCPLCGIGLTGKRNLPNSKHLDHIVPIAVGGTHTHGNVRIICASCNLRRPKSGSDYSGLVTLWAQGPSPIKRPRKKRIGNIATCRKRLHPWIPANIKITAGKKRCRACDEARDRARSPLRACGNCGTLTSLPGKQEMCPGCILSAVRTAVVLRIADQLAWAEIAPRVGYKTATGICYAVLRAGIKAEDLAVFRGSAPKRETKTLCRCGATAYRKGRCRECIEEAAVRAVRLRTEEGWTLRMIADELGYSSITSVTNLMKTLVEVDSRMGRPRTLTSIRNRT